MTLASVFRKFVASAVSGRLSRNIACTSNGICGSIGRADSPFPSEALAVKRLARELGIAHRTLRWTGKKPATGIQQAARTARYRLLAD